MYESRRRSLCFRWGSPSRRSLCPAIYKKKRQKSIYAVKCIAGKTKENKRNTATEILQYIKVLYNIHELINNINVLKM